MPLTAEVRDRLAVDAQAIIDRYPQARSALLPLLHLVQSEEGYVSPDGIAFCADRLGLTTAEVAAVATFYTQYKRHPNGTYTVGVCTNTLCAIMGGDEIFRSLEEHLGVGHDETTDDGAITLEKIECNAACDYAPVVMVNWEFFDNQTPESARRLTDDLRGGGDVAPSRGAASVCSFKQVSRVLAGFNDGRAGEGVAAGEATLRGTVLAKEQGWTAPEGAGGSSKSGSSKGAGSSAAAGGRKLGQVGAQPTAQPSAQSAAESGTRAESSAHDAPPVSEGTKERAGTTAGKPPGEATHGESDDGTGTSPPADSTDASKPEA
jgi:NADH-quinone oxidoreductase subunit E